MLQLRNSAQIARMACQIPRVLPRITAQIRCKIVENKINRRKAIFEFLDLKMVANDAQNQGASNGIFSKRNGVHMRMS